MAKQVQLHEKDIIFSIACLFVESIGSRDSLEAVKVLCRLLNGVLISITRGTAFIEPWVVGKSEVKINVFLIGWLGQKRCLSIALIEIFVAFFSFTICSLLGTSQTSCELCACLKRT